MIPEDTAPEDPTDRGHVILAWIAGAVVLALVLIFVFTRVGEAEGWGGYRTVTTAQVQLPAGDFLVVLKNENTGSLHPWARKGFATRDECDKAIRGVNDALRALADPDPKVEIVEPQLADPELVASVKQVLAFVIANTGVAPNLSISCRMANARDA